MTFLLNYFNTNDKNKESKASKAELEEIEILKKQLVDIGFAPGEVNFMIRQNIKHKKKSLTEISSSEIIKIKKVLSDQLEMSKRCLKIIND